MVNDGDRYCRACGEALNVLGNCPKGCDGPPDKAEGFRPLRLVDDHDFEDDVTEWEPDEESEEWRP